MDNYKEVQIELLNFVVQLCEEHSLNYFLVGGTLLGAVRHKGYIPWDDDIDIALPREDYDKLLVLAENCLPKEMFLQTYHTDPNYLHMFAKIRKNDTVFLQKSLKHLDINHGIFIDIFPIDGTPKNHLLARIHINKVNLYSQLLHISYLNHYIMRDKKKIENFKNLIKELIKLTIITFNLCTNIRRIIEKETRKYDYHNSSYVANYYGVWGFKERMLKDVFMDTCKVEFEGEMYSAPNDWDRYLINIYGEYNVLPPIEKRVSHHDIEKINIHERIKN